jgi:hypothetical protein
MGRTGLVLACLSAVATAGCELDPRTNPNVVTDPQLVAGSQPDSLAPLYEMDNPNRLPGRFIVRFKPVVGDAEVLARALVAKLGGSVYQPLRSLRGFWGELPGAAIDPLRRNPNIAYIEADVAIPLSGPGDTIQQDPRWPLDRIDQRQLPLNNTYEYSAVGSGVRIWIVDMGVDRHAPDLAGRIDESWYVTNNGKDPYAPCNTHGTNVATVAAGTASGVAKGAIIHAARVDTDDCEHLSTGAASFAFEFIGDWSPQPAVANYSAGKECGIFGCGQTVDDAAKYARQRGVTVVVSAGNDGRDACDYAPAHVTELLTVSGSDINDQRWSSNNWGSCVDLFAPVELNAATSYAAPMVTGVAALILQLYPTFSPSKVEAGILSNATQGVLGNIGSGSPNRLLHSRFPDLNPLSAYISGPSTIGPYTSCTWYAAVSGGDAPYAYQWYRDGSPVGTSTQYSVRQGGNSDFDLGLVVTDGVGRHSASDLTVTIDPTNDQKLCES